jgi:hypothetical protein
VEDAEGLDRRRAALGQILDNLPRVHPTAPNGKVWRTSRSCYEFLAGQVRSGSRTLETGAGLSTVLFAAWGCDHLAVVPFAEEAEAIEGYCASMDIDTSTLRFDLRPSEVALPELAGSGPRDLVFIDGLHGFPMPVIDWFYGAGQLGRDGVVVFDDAHLPQVSWFLDGFVDRDERWEAMEIRRKWRAYRRTSEGPLAESEVGQAFFNPARVGASRRVVSRLKRAL